MIPRSARARREFVRFYKFSVVGAIGAVVDFGSFNLLTLVAGMGGVAASVISFVAALTSNFIWNRIWTYPDSRSKRVHHQAIQFGLVNLVGLAIRTPVFALLDQPATDLASSLISQAGLLASTPLSGLEPLTLGRNLALAAAVLVVMFWNFGINRIWTYSDVD
ncbi:MAG: GtrA family protein [Anaerolineales bacterium]|nr:GtrA family protein [Anaerolineales bacterium]